MSTFSQTSHLVEQKAAKKSEPKLPIIELNEPQTKSKPTGAQIAVESIQKVLEESKDPQEKFSLKKFEVTENREFEESINSNQPLATDHCQGTEGNSDGTDSNIKTFKNAAELSRALSEALSPSDFSKKSDKDESPKEQRELRSPLWEAKKEDAKKENGAQSPRKNPFSQETAGSSVEFTGNGMATQHQRISALKNHQSEMNPNQSETFSATARVEQETKGYVSVPSRSQRPRDGPTRNILQPTEGCVSAPPRSPRSRDGPTGNIQQELAAKWAKHGTRWLNLRREDVRGRSEQVGEKTRTITRASESTKFSEFSAAQSRAPREALSSGDFTQGMDGRQEGKVAGRVEVTSEAGEGHELQNARVRKGVQRLGPSVKAAIELLTRLEKEGGREADCERVRNSLRQQAEAKGMFVLLGGTKEANQSVSKEVSDSKGAE